MPDRSERSVGPKPALLIAPLRIVRYHTVFWQFTGRHLGLGRPAGREQALAACGDPGR